MVIRTSLRQLGSVPPPYKKDEIIFEQSVPGTYDFDVKSDCVVGVSDIGAGGGAAATQSENACAGSAGASGSGFVGEIKLNKGKYRAVVGLGGIAQFWLDGNCYGGVGGATILYQIDEQNNLTPLINCAGGGGGHTWWRSSASPAPLGAKPVITAQVIGTPTLNRQGNPGTNYNSGPGGVSILVGTTYGKGGDTNGWGRWMTASPGTDGYVKLVFKRMRI